MNGGIVVNIGQIEAAKIARAMRRGLPPPAGTRWLVRFDRASIANIPKHCAKGRHLYMREGGGITGLRRKARRFKSPERARAAASGVRPGISWCVVRLLPRAVVLGLRHRQLMVELETARAELAKAQGQAAKHAAKSQGLFQLFGWDDNNTPLKTYDELQRNRADLVETPDRVDVKGIVERLESEHEARIAKLNAAHAAELERCMSERPPAPAVARELARCLELVQERALWHSTAKTVLLSVAGHLRRGLRIEEAIDATARVQPPPPAAPVKVPT